MARNTSAPRKILICSYGGGHSKAVIPVARAVLERGDTLDLIGFTTAFAEFQRAGLPARSIESLIDPTDDAPYLALARDLAPPTDHPDITEAQTLAYTALGLRDLMGRLGDAAGIALYKEKGRFAFEPVEVAKRALIKARPDLVVATTSPRMELAFLRAARALGLPALAIANQFIIDERAWVLSGDYPDHLAVLCGEIRDTLGEGGHRPRDVRVTGSPAFDALARFGDAQGPRAQVRAGLGLAQDETVILWPLNNAVAARTGEAFLAPEALVDLFETFCEAHPGLRYILRRHPNGPTAPPPGMVRGLFDDGTLSAGESLAAADVVCGEMSTVLLEGILLGKPVACYGFADYVPFIKWGLAEELTSLDQIAPFALHQTQRARKTIDMPPLGTATRNVTAFMDDILRQSAPT